MPVQSQPAAPSCQSSLHQISQTPEIPPMPTQLSYELTVQTLRSLRKKVSQSYISEHEMRQLKINCTDLEFDPTVFPPRADALLELMSPQEMQDLAEQHSFSGHRTIGYLDYTNFNTAAHVVDQFVHYLNRPEDSQYDGDPRLWDPMLLEKSPWELFCPGDSSARLLHCIKPWKEQMWMVSSFLEIRDGSCPHITCFSINEARPREDALLFSEVWCLLAMGLLSFLKPQNLKHKIIPVTMISGSSRQFRIVQGYANGDKGTIDLRKTRIVDLGEGEEDSEEQHWHEFMTFMRWILARPVGETT
ncbi:hypothetical protein F5Y07DRAFT_405099 [Xylaria sp. FL0933]|nr:hypothetical protein F5Y07DRAFT_405099 [Xylaria sp. FL0933]